MTQKYVVIINGDVIGTHIYTKSEASKHESDEVRLMTPEEYVKSRRR